MARRGWARRLDDRADSLLRRRFGFGLTEGPEPTMRQELRRTLLLAGGVSAILIVALVLSDQTQRVPVVLGPALGAVLGTLGGRAMRQRGRRRQR